MNHCSKLIGRTTGIVLLISMLAGCGINNIPTYDEAVSAMWSQVQNQYQRRADLVPNLVETVKGFAAQEKEVLTEVVEARAKATKTTISPDMLNDAGALSQFQQSQDALTSALSKLMLVVERYPDLKSNQNFLALQSQLEGTENRISVARRDYVLAVQKYNTEIRTFPGRIWKMIMYPGYESKANFEAAEGAAEAPKVNLN